MTPSFLSDRDRLLLAFANLASYGIAARDAYGDSATEAHAAVAADLRLRHPHGLGAYVFWTRTDDASRFDAYGSLISELPLHTGGEGTAEAVRTAAALVGIELAVADDGLRVLTEDRDARPRLAQLRPAAAPPASSASFCARVSCLIRHSRLRAARSLSSSHEAASSTGSRRAV